MPETFKIEGLKELEAGLEQFKKSTARAILERALKRAARPIVDDAKANVPVDTGRLKKNINMKVIRSDAGRAAYAKAKRGGASNAEAVEAAKSANREARAAGNGPTALVRVQASTPYAHFVEWGTRKNPAHPFLGPAFHKERSSVVKTIAADIKVEMEKSAKRIAARAAKKGK